eukprot:ANDGO_05215.mRNA.1 Diatom spindle kinesin-1
MGNTLDKRSLRKEHSSEFQKCIEMYLASSRNTDKIAAVELKVAASQESSNSSHISVVVRKRPLFPHETARGEFDVVSTSSRTITVHDCRLESDLKKKYIDHHRYAFNRVYGDTQSTDALFKEQVVPMINSFCVNPGSRSTILMFGQTGSGKTFTMTGIQKLLAADVFSKVPELSLSAFEIQGNDTVDLLSDGQKSVKILEDEDGSVHVRFCSVRQVRSPAELLQGVKQAGDSRVKSATGVHDSSSRSHAVYRLVNPANGSQFLLVDLAGTERKEDSSRHNAQQRKEASEINSSLMVLKECVRKMQASSSNAAHVPFRRSKLTLFLKSSLSRVQAEDKAELATLVIGTVSPSSTDTEHTLCTLDNVELMDSTSAETEPVVDLVRSDITVPVIEIPKKPVLWNAEQVQRFYSSVRGLTIPASLDGKQLVRLTQQRFVQMANGNSAVGSKAYDMLRQETERVASLEAEKRRILADLN